MGNSRPVVSICCTAYNHEKYIKDAIEGFLKQTTDFPLEILIHDDASTDKTAQIIKEYESRYPEIIKPIYQKENKYSKGHKINPEFNFSRAKGDYIAICEGDDYWIDPLKLQKQVTEMKKNSQYNISFHPAIIKWENGKRKDKLIAPYGEKINIFKTNEIILMDGGGIPTNSLMFKREVLPAIMDFFKFAKEAPMLDYYIQILGSIDKGALFIPDVMSVYRKGVEASWTSKITNTVKGNDYLIVRLKKISANNKLNEFTNNNYTQAFSSINQKETMRLLKYIDIDIKTKNNIYKQNKIYLSMKNKLYWKVVCNNLVYTKILHIISGSEIFLKIYRRLKY